MNRPYFVDSTEREGIGGWKEAQRQGEDKVTFTDNSIVGYAFFIFHTNACCPPVFNWQWLIPSAERERVSKSIAKQNHI
jgi:hypothetical protein